MRIFDIDISPESEIMEGHGTLRVKNMGFFVKQSMGIKRLTLTRCCCSKDFGP